MYFLRTFSRGITEGEKNAMLLGNYHYFLAIAEHGSVTKAARALYVSQSSLTKYIHRLEKELETELFDHSKKPLVLSEAGRLFRQYLMDTQALTDSFYGQLSRLRETKKMVLRISTGPFYASMLMPLLLPAMHQAYPELEIQILTGDDPAIYEQLMSGQSDMALFMNPQQYRNIDYLKVADERILLCCNSELPALRRHTEPILGNGLQEKPIDPRIFFDVPFLVPQKGLTLYEITNQIFSDYSIKPVRQITVPSVQSGMNLAVSGVGVSIVQWLITRTKLVPEHSLFFPIGDPPLSCEIGLAFRHDMEHLPQMDEFVKRMQALYQ